MSYFRMLNREIIFIITLAHLDGGFIIIILGVATDLSKSFIVSLMFIF